MSTPTNIPETPMGETEQDSYFKSKEKFQQQLQDIFQTILRLTGPDQFDQLCQWMEYKQYLTIDDFYDNSCYDPEKFDIKGPATEYKWKGKMNHLSPNVAQKLKSFVRWMAHEERPYELLTEFRQPLQVQIHLEMPRILVQLGHTQRTWKLAPQTDPKWSPTRSSTRYQDQMSVKCTRRTLRMACFTRAPHAPPSLSNFTRGDSDFGEPTHSRGTT